MFKSILGVKNTYLYIEFEEVGAGKYMMRDIVKDKVVVVE